MLFTQSELIVPVSPQAPAQLGIRFTISPSQHIYLEMLLLLGDSTGEGKWEAIEKKLKKAKKRHLAEYEPSTSKI